MQQQTSEQLRVWFRNVEPIYAELFNAAHAMCGNYDLAEYALRSAILDVWLQNVSGGMGFRERLRSALRLAAFEAALSEDAEDAEFTWPGVDGAREDDPILGQLAQEPVELQRLVVLRHGCGLPVKAISQLTGDSQSQIRAELSRFESRCRRRLSGQDRGRAEALISQMSTVTGYLGLYSLLTIFLIAPLMVGFINAFRVLLVQGDREIPTNMYKIATKGYWHKVWGMFLMGVFVFLWSMLFVIPGIIKAFSYAMTPYILEEHPELTANEAIDHSRAMMKGHKFDLFWLYLSFIGWGILCIPTLGIGTFWLIPYMQTAQASFYEDVKADYEVNGGLV